MKTATDIREMISMERPVPLRGTQEVLRLVHTSDNMVRRVAAAQARLKRSEIRKEA